MTEQRPDERVEAIRREYQHLSGFGFQSKAVADALNAYDAERARAERAEADVARLREVLNRSLFGGTTPMLRAGLLMLDRAYQGRPEYRDVADAIEQVTKDIEAALAGNDESGDSASQNSEAQQ